MTIANNRSLPHKRTRSDHALETAEDYVEAVFDILQDSERCRVQDLADHFGVSHVTVTKTVSRLCSEGLLETSPYKPIALTNAGKKLAKKSKARHSIVFEFLIWLGVDEQNAMIDSEGIEHHVGEKTLAAMSEKLNSGEQ